MINKKLGDYTQQEIKKLAKDFVASKGGKPEIIDSVTLTTEIIREYTNYDEFKILVNGKPFMKVL